jgi:hypothetical protein
MATPTRLDPLLVAQPSSGTQDDDDNPNDEHEGENEPPVRELNDLIEAPEEFVEDQKLGEDGQPGIEEEWTDLEDDETEDGREG